jgi:hypothetical protein
MLCIENHLEDIPQPEIRKPLQSISAIYSVKYVVKQQEKIEDMIKGIKVSFNLAEEASVLQLTNH